MYSYISSLQNSSKFTLPSSIHFSNTRRPLLAISCLHHPCLGVLGNMCNRVDIIHK